MDERRPDPAENHQQANEQTAVRLFRQASDLWRARALAAEASLRGVVGNVREPIEGALAGVRDARERLNGTTSDLGSALEKVEDLLAAALGELQPAS